MQEKDVFISYKAEELKEAEWVKERLEKEGISCWLAPGSIPGGSSYAAQIPKAIRECQAFVLILSQKAQESKWVPRELDQAINANKLILPFMIEDCPLKDDFSFYLSNVQRYEAWQNREKAFSSMVRVIRALTDERKKADSSMLGVIRALADARSEAAAETEAARGTGGTAASVSGKTAEIPVNKPGRKEVKAAGEGKTKGPGAAGKKRGTGKKKLSFKKILLAVIAVFIVLEAIGAVRSAVKEQIRKREHAANAFLLAGKEVSKTDTSFYLKDATVTEEDISLFALFNRLIGITFESCTFETDLSSLLGENISNLTIRNCDLSAEQLGTLDFSAAPKLSQLDLSGNPSAGEAFQSGDITLPETLTVLKLNGTGISDPAFLAPLTRLSILDISGNELADISALKECTSLTGLDVSGNQLESLEGIEACIRMETLRAGNNRIGDLDAMSNMTILKKVDLSGNRIETIDVLAKSAGTLEELGLADNAVADISPLEKCTALKYLALRHNAIVNMEYVRSLENLQTLDVSENAITVANGLSHLKSLEKLDISDNPLEATFGIWGSEWPAGVKTVIDASNCGITNGMTLKEELNYYMLDLHGSNFDRIPDAVAAARGDTVVLDWNSGMKPEELKELRFNRIILLDVPLDQVVSLEDTVGSKLTHMPTEEYESKKAESE